MFTEATGSLDNITKVTTRNLSLNSVTLFHEIKLLFRLYIVVSGIPKYKLPEIYRCILISYQGFVVQRDVTNGPRGEQ